MLPSCYQETNVVSNCIVHMAFCQFPVYALEQESADSAVSTAPCKVLAPLNRQLSPRQVPE